MKSNFVKVAKFLEQNFPGLAIEGGLYPAPPIAEFANNILSLLQIIGMTWMMVGGEKILRTIGFRGALPGFYWTIQENPVPLGIFLFLLAPQLIQGLSKKGAFEVFLDDQEIFSRISTGAFPSADDLVTSLKAAGLAYAGDAAAASS